MVSLSTFLTVIGIIVTVASLMGGVVATWIQTKRKHSGKIETSEAAVLWETVNKLLATIQRDKERAEDQRDKLIAAYEEKLIPMVAAINMSLSGLSGSISEVLTILRTTGPLPGDKES